MWLRNAPVATVMARGQHAMLTEGFLATSAELAAAAQAGGWQAALTEAAFDSVMRRLAATGGDPPADPSLRRIGTAVVRGGQVDHLVATMSGAVDALVPDLDARLALAATDDERAGARLALALVAGALAAPRVEILRFLGAIPKVTGEEPDRFGEALQAALDDQENAEPLLVVALDLAPAEGVAAVADLLLRRSRPLDPDTFRRCASALATVAPGGGDSVEYLLGTLGARVDAAGLGQELFPALAEAYELLLAGPIAPDNRLDFSLTAAAQWRRVGRLDRADGLLVAARSALDSPACRLRTAVFESEVRASCSDRAGATSILLAALTSPGEQQLADRRKAVLTLIANWPITIVSNTGPVPAREGIDAWIDEAERLIDGSEDWVANVSRVQLMASLIQLGLVSRAAAVRAQVDFAAYRASSADFASWSGGVEAWATHVLDGPEAGPDGAKSYADLGLERRFMEAAAKAEADAELALRRGFRIQAFDALAAAGEMYRLARDDRAALDAFERAFGLLERDLLYLPYAELVVARLAAWPDRYQMAADTALRLGDAARAVALAETGRARAIGARLGRLPVEGDDAARLSMLWRRAVADAANELVDARGWTGLAVDSDTTLAINALRRALVERGVPIEDLSPVSPPVDVLALIARMASASRPTVVLYAIASAEGIRFIRITAAGATELTLDRTAQASVLVAVHRFEDAERTSSDVAKDAPGLLRDLLEAVGPPLEPLLGGAIAGFEGGRLIWVPHGALAALPIMAAPLRGGVLAEAVSVMVAESLVSAAAAFEPDVAQPLSGLAIKGAHGPGQATTEGGASLLPATPGRPVDEVMPASLDELNLALAGDPQRPTLLQLSCHGVFRWDAPLESVLRLGFDLPVADLFDRLQMPARALVVLGTCDSGTIAQTELNEGIGIPAGLLSSGAHTVIGAAWPVAQLAAVGICRMLIKELVGGASSPEALTRAALWLRTATVADVGAELAAAGHPLAPLIAARSTSFRSRTFDAPEHWASYVHWGGAWRIQR